MNVNPEVVLKYPFVFTLGLISTYALLSLCRRLGGGARHKESLSGEPGVGAGACAMFLGLTLTGAAIFAFPWLPLSWATSWIAGRCACESRSCPWPPWA